MDYQYHLNMDLTQQKPIMDCDEHIFRYFDNMPSDTYRNSFSDMQKPAETQIMDLNMDDMEDSEIFEMIKSSTPFGEPDYSKFHSNKDLGIELSMANSNLADHVENKELNDYEADISDVKNQSWTFSNVNGNPCASLSEIRDDHLGMLTDDDIIKALEIEDVSEDCGAIEGRCVHVHVQNKHVVAQKTRTVSQMQLFDKATNNMFYTHNEMSLAPNEIMDEDEDVFEHSDVKFHRSEKMFEHENMMLRRVEAVFVKTEDSQTLRSHMSQTNENTPLLRETVNSISQVEQYSQNVQSVSLQTEVMYRKRKSYDIDHNHLYYYPND